MNTSTRRALDRHSVFRYPKVPRKVSLHVMQMEASSHAFLLTSLGGRACEATINTMQRHVALSVLLSRNFWRVLSDAV